MIVGAKIWLRDCAALPDRVPIVTDKTCGIPQQQAHFVYDNYVISLTGGENECGMKWAQSRKVLLF